MWEDDVRSGGDEPTPAEPKSGGDASKGDGGDKQPKEDKDSIRLSRGDYDQLREELAELRYWKNSRDEEPEPKAAKREEPVEDEDDITALLAEDPEKFTDEFSAEGLKSLVKRGFITEKRAKRLLGDIAERVITEKLETLVDGKISKAQKAMLSDAEILQKYPDLNSPNSPLTQRTKEIYREIMSEDKGTPKSTALKLAARTAAAELKESREERIARQSGGGERRGGGGYTGEDDEDGDLTPTQKKILAGFNADGGVTVSEEAYRARAKKGVNMSSRGGYKPGSMSW